MTEKAFKGLNNKKVIKLVNKILKDDRKRELYSPEEIAYMERQTELMKREREIRKLQKKIDKGFGYGISDLQSPG
jgi:hypothetical protein